MNNQLKKVRPSGMSLVLAILVPILFFWKTLTVGLLPMPLDALVGLYHPFRDYFSERYSNGVPYRNYTLTDPVLQQYPWKWLAMESWKQGEVPLENPYNFAGTPLLANIQAGVFYPLNALFFLGEFPIMWSLFIISQPILASLFFYLWLKHQRIHPLASVFASIVWAFSSFNLVWLEWGNIVHAGLWLALSLLCIDKLKTQIFAPSLRNVIWQVLLQFSLVSSLFAGHFQVTLYLLAAVGLYWLVRLGISKRSFSLLVVHGVLFLVLTSIQWLPAIRFANLSNRDVEQQDVLSREGFFIHPKQLVQLMAPDYFGNPATGNYRGKWNYSEQVLYIGIVPLLFAMMATFRGGGRDAGNSPSLVWFSLGLMTVGLFFGVENPIARLPYLFRIPFVSDLQPTRLSYLVTFGLSVLSGVGMDRLIRSPKSSTIRLVKLAMYSSLVLFGLFIVSKRLSSPDRVVAQRNLILPTSFLLLAGAGLIVPWLSRRQEGAQQPLISLFLVTFYLFITSVDLFRFGWKFTPFSPIEYLYPRTPVIRYLVEHMDPSDRYMTLDRRILPPNANIIYRLKTIEGYDPVYFSSYALKISEMENGEPVSSPGSFGRIIRPTNFRSPIASELGVNYLLTLWDSEELDWEKVFQEGETRIFRRIR